MTFPMEIGSLLGTLVLAALVMGIVVMMPIAIGRNLVRGHDYRNRLNSELSSLRLSKMLGFLGIDKNAYQRFYVEVMATGHGTADDHVSLA